MITNFIKILLLIVICGCSKSPFSQRHKEISLWMNEKNKIKILATTEMIADLVNEIGKEKIFCLTLITGQLDPHSYELVKGDDELLLNSQIIFSNGLGLEHGASLSHLLKSSPKNVFIGDQIKKEHPSKILLVDGATDPHIWMDISLWKEGVDPIVNELIKVDPENALYYKKNGQLLKDRMDEEHNFVYAKVQKIPSDKRYLVTSHDAFNYFAKAYLAQKGEINSWKERFIAPEGLAPQTQLSSLDIQKIIDHLKKYNIHVIFPETNVSQDSVRKVKQAANEKGLKIIIAKEALFGDCMMENKSLGTIGYFEMIKHNANTLYHYLAGEKDFE